MRCSTGGIDKVREMVERNKKCSESACKNAQHDKHDNSGQRKSLSYPLMKMILLLTLPIATVGVATQSPGISRTTPSSVGETIVAGL
jgi:hypothetical protein